MNKGLKLYASRYNHPIPSPRHVQSEAINKAACKLAREAAAEGDALVSASISETPSYREGKGKDAVVEQFRNQVAFLKTCDVDFIICEVPV